jgi:hypothetical protein
MKHTCRLMLFLVVILLSNEGNSSLWAPYGFWIENAPLIGGYDKMYGMLICCEMFVVDTRS